MKKITFVLFMCIVLATGCGNKKNELPEELQDKEWMFYDEVLLWFNDQMEVEKVLFWGETSIAE